MISFSEARQIILTHSTPLGIVRRSLGKLLGMVSVESIRATFDLPRFDNSAVDGYGVRLADAQAATPNSSISLRLVGSIRAGDTGKIRLQPGETVQILTGAPVPPSVEAVIMQEFTEQDGATIRFFYPAKAGDNIRRKGEEFSKGKPVIAAGTVMTPPVIGLLANLGHASAKVYRKPKVGLITTGSELIQPGRKLKPGQIYDANTAAFSAALQSLGIESVRIYHTKDERAATQRAFAKALKENDVLISLGGISVGAFDFVKGVAEDLGIETLFWRISIKPGKPVYFGKRGKKLVFGLPGNPVSALVTYHQLVQPALKKMMGYPEETTPRFTAILKQPLRKKAGRQEFVRGVITYDGTFKVSPTVGQDSHMLGGLAAANCLIDFPLDAAQLAPETPVQVDPLDWTPKGF